MTETKSFDPDRLQAIIRAYGIYETDLLGYCGYKKETGILEHPDANQLKYIKKFFAEKYPLVNFDFILGKTSSPNKLIDLRAVRYWMNAKNISITQFNNYIKSELNEDNAFYKITNGIYPRVKKQSDVIMEYLEKIISAGNQYEYRPEEKPKAPVVTLPTKRKVVEKKTSSSAKYLTDPDNYRENKIDIKTLVQMCNSEGYSMQGFVDMAYPGQAGLQTIYSLFNGSLSSLSNQLVAGIQAALDCDIFYLEESQRIGAGNRTQHHYFPKDPHKVFAFQHSFISEVPTALLKTMANNAGISWHILHRAKYGEKIYFMDTTLRRMFNRDLMNVLKVSDLNDITYSLDDSKIPARLLPRSIKKITMPDVVKTKPKEEKEISVTVNPSRASTPDNDLIKKMVERNKKILNGDTVTAEKTVDKKVEIKRTDNIDIKIPETKETSKITKKPVEKAPKMEVIHMDNKKEITLEEVVAFISTCSDEKLELITKLCDNFKTKNALMAEIEKLG